MCLYRGTWYPDCNHIRFELHLFCRELLRQLNRINSAEERANLALPFDADTAGCAPHVALADAVVGRGDPWRSNVVAWVTSLEEVCPDCEG
ncbi:hypothetical protein NUU61_005135 [Penicillium alfredii]|uniref:Uncharacterized protein n=1 Tax=Penicillium alfredii TaxID=1506179 RepID=A0A9W9F966_9EURO|nr:uncharacterized protein NUU61_005135 [Penicillium alfredii]KAJ5095779.1 hypothetical protein NUU61_005135 [Penicillium alfredii]